MELKLNNGKTIKFEELYNIVIDSCHRANLLCCKHRYVWLGRETIRDLTQALGMNLSYCIDIVVDKRDGMAQVFSEYFETIEECLQRKKFIYETYTKLR